MSTFYQHGTDVRLTATYALGGVATDPTTVTFKVLNPDGTVLTKAYPADTEVVHEATGRFHLDVPTPEVGTYPYRVESTGTPKGAAESSFSVLVSPFA